MRNGWDLRHRLILERLTADLLTANVGVLMEPGPLDPRREAGKTAPDQLITYQATDRQAGVPRCVTTDVTVHETVTAALVRNRTTVRSKLHNEARLKRRLHEEPSRAAGCDFANLCRWYLRPWAPCTRRRRSSWISPMWTSTSVYCSGSAQAVGCLRPTCSTGFLVHWREETRGSSSECASAVLQRAHVARQHNRAAADEHGWGIGRALPLVRRLKRWPNTTL